MINYLRRQNMRHGFISVASATPKIKLADCEYNAERIM